MDKYTTKDFYLAAYLAAKGVPLDSFTRSGGITTFIFAPKDETDGFIQSYFSFTATINPQLYGNAIRSLKAMIHSNADAERHTNSYVEQSGQSL